MKILVSFEPKIAYDNFEGARLRKSIKGALEATNIPYVSEETKDFDIAHIMSPISEPLVDECVRKGIPVVVSALYCESDKYASFIKYSSSSKKGRKETLTPEAIRVLSKATLITVPTKAAKQFLIDAGIQTPIDILYPTVNLTRFTQYDAEKGIFFRHYQEEEDKKLVVCLGSYDNVDGITAFIKLAGRYPNVLFYYFSQDTLKMRYKIKELMKITPRNLKFKQIPSDDIYRSVIINASIFTYFGYSTAGITTIFEAMAGHCDVVLRKQHLFEELLTDGVYCHIGEYSETISSIIRDLLDGKLASTNQKGFEMVASLGLDVFGKKLKEIYTKLLKEQK